MNTIHPKIKLKLHKSYYNKGFFNVSVDFDRYIGGHKEKVTMQLGQSGEVLDGWIDRSANNISTPRIYFGAKLRNWFQSNYNIDDSIDVYILSPNMLKIGDK